MTAAKTAKTANQRLAELVKGAELTQSAALALFNRGLGIRGIKESTWKGYFCSPQSSRYRQFRPEFLSRAERVFGPLLKARKADEPGICE